MHWVTLRFAPCPPPRNPGCASSYIKVIITVTYHTAWVDQASRLNLRLDVYGLDRKQLEAIGQQQPTLSANNSDSHESNLTRRAR